MEQKSVCQGYADLCAALLRAEGIPTKVTNGYAMGAGTTGMWTDTIMNSDDSNHAWNEAFVDGRWIVFDSTWDSNNKYAYGEFSEGTGLTAYAYFDPTIEMFSNTHYIMDKEERLFKKLEQALSCFVKFKQTVKRLSIKNIEAFKIHNEAIAHMKEQGISYKPCFGF